MSYFFRQALFGLKRIDGLEFILQRTRAGALNGTFVHAGLIVVADFLFNGASPGSTRRRLLQNVADNRLAALFQFIEAAPLGTVRGDRILCLPFAACVGVKICTGVDVFVEHVSTEAHIATLPLLGGRRRLRQDRKSTRLNSSHTVISYAVFCLKKKTTSARLRSRASSRNPLSPDDARPS